MRQTLGVQHASLIEQTDLLVREMERRGVRHGVPNNYILEEWRKLLSDPRRAELIENLSSLIEESKQAGIDEELIEMWRDVRDGWDRWDADYKVALKDRRS